MRILDFPVSRRQALPPTVRAAPRNWREVVACTQEGKAKNRKIRIADNNRRH